FIFQKHGGLPFKPVLMGESGDRSDAVEQAAYARRGHYVDSSFEHGSNLGGCEIWGYETWESGLLQFEQQACGRAPAFADCCISSGKSEGTQMGDAFVAIAFHAEELSPPNRAVEPVSGAIPGN